MLQAHSFPVRPVLWGVYACIELSQLTVTLRKDSFFLWRNCWQINDEWQQCFFAVVTSHSIGLGLRPGWLCSLCFNSDTVWQKLWKRKAFTTEEAGFLVLCGWTKQPWEFRGSQRKENLQREGQWWLQSVLTKPLSEREPVFPSWSQWRRRRCAHLLSPGRSYLLTQQGKSGLVSLRAQKDLTRAGKANQTTFQANHQIIFLQQEPY